MKKFGCLILMFVIVVVLGVFILLLSDFELVPAANKVGVVEIKGVILNSQETVKSLKEFRKNADVKAVVVRIDSPGGAIGPSQEIFKEIKRTAETKPVVASLGGVAASGGFYVACGANHIVANPGTLTGSIGVIIHFPNLRELFGKIGYDQVTIKSGEFKDVGNPSREMTPEEKALMQNTIDQAYRMFLSDVARGRNLPEEEVQKVADGRVIMGQTAYEMKLVDELGNFEDAVNKAVSLGKIEGEPKMVYAKKKGYSLIDLLLGSDTSERLNDYLFDSFSFIRYELPNWR